MKIKFVLQAVLFAAAVSLLSGCKKSEPAHNEIVIWTYDSFTSEWGPGANIARNFLEESGINVKWESEGDAGSLLARVLLEGAAAKADIVLGIDGSMSERALSSGLFENYRPQNAEKIIAELRLPESSALLPYDYSYFAFIDDSVFIKTPPTSLEELCSPSYKNKIIIMDPRTSSPGLGLLAWTIAAYPSDWQAYWRRFLPSVLTIASGWDSGYGLFLKEEAPFVFSYTTSPAYHIENEQTDRYRAAYFDGGHPVQVEFAGLLKNAPRKEAAKRFISFMFDEGFQKEIPTGNWMYPVTNIELPESFRLSAKPRKILETAPPSEAEINEWTALTN